MSHKRPKVVQEEDLDPITGKLYSDEEIKEIKEGLKTKHNEKKHRYKAYPKKNENDFFPNVIFHKEKLYAIYRGKKFAMGGGAHGTVKAVQDLETGEWYALKIIPRKENDSKFIKNEIKNLKKANQYILSYTRTKKKTSKQTEILMKYAHGESVRRLINKHAIDGGNWLHICKAMMIRLMKLHTKAKLLHCDIKPENVHYCAETNKAKWIDLGYSQGHPSKKFNYRIGTKCYMPPEIKDRNKQHYIYNEATEVFSLGVTIAKILELTDDTYDLTLTGSELFIANKIILDKEIRKKVLDFLKLMTAKDSLKRPSLIACLMFFEYIELLLDKDLNIALRKIKAIENLFNNAMQDLKDNPKNYVEGFSKYKVVFKEENKEFPAPKTFLAINSFFGNINNSKDVTYINEQFQALRDELKDKQFVDPNTLSGLQRFGNTAYNTVASFFYCRRSDTTARLYSKIYEILQADYSNQPTISFGL